MVMFRISSRISGMLKAESLKAMDGTWKAIISWPVCLERLARPAPKYTFYIYFIYSH